MTIIFTPVQLACLDNEELAQLAVSWREHARRGHREAYGPAHALEVEQRQRQRARRLEDASTRPPEAAARVIPVRAWWKFWKRYAVGHDSMRP